MTTAILNEVERIEKALVEVFRSRFGNDVYCVDGIWFVAFQGENEWENKTVNLTAIAGDLERELSC